MKKMKNKRLLISVIFLFLFSNAYSQCGQISLIGEFNGWTGDHFMEQDSLNPDLYSTIIYLTPEDDMSIPPDGIIEMKFRKDASWEFNWGNIDFPTGVAILNGPNFPVPYSSFLDSTQYHVTFNCISGEYSFGSLCGEISLIGEFTNWSEDLFLEQDENYPQHYTTFLGINEDDDLSLPPDGIIEMSFREDTSWNVNWSNLDFPSGIGIQDGPYIPVPYDNIGLYTNYFVSFNCASGEYFFEETCGEVSMIGEFNSWTGDYALERDSSDVNIWTTIFTISEDDDETIPPDGIIEVKFRENSDWSVNWSNLDFPSGIGIQNGPNIPVPYVSWADSTSYILTFNCSTGEYFFDCITCGDISLIGEFSGWSGDHFMEKDLINPEMYSTIITISEEDDLSTPLDGIIEMVFRENADWEVNWGGEDFPEGIAFQDGPHIPVPYNNWQDSTNYFVTFNCITGEYNFQETDCGLISIIGEFSGWTADLDMQQDSIIPNLWNISIAFTEEDDPDGNGVIELKFRENHDWEFNWGNTDFPTGVAILNGPNIPVPLGSYLLEYNCVTYEYSFDETSSIGKMITNYSITLAPNPAKEIVTIRSTTGFTTQWAKISIRDISGREFLAIENAFSDKQDHIMVRTEQLKPGIYFIHVNFSNDQSFIEKLIIQ